MAEQLEQQKNIEQKPTSEQEPAAKWQFHTENSDSPVAIDSKKIEPITWTASEFIHHQKNIGWYAMLTVGAAVLAAVIFFLTHDKISTGVVIFAALVLGFYASRKPRILDYKLDDSGLTIGTKFYAYDAFKSFSVIDEGSISSIILMPLKRFMPLLSLYFDPKDEDKIAQILADRLPLAEHKHDAVDRFMKRIRF